jgi:hypothetical protein
MAQSSRKLASVESVLLARLQTGVPAGACKLVVRAGKDDEQQQSPNDRPVEGKNDKP